MWIDLIAKRKVEPSKTAEYVRDLLELSFEDLEPVLEDLIGDSLRCDTKQVLSELLLQITQTRQAIESSARKLESLPASI